MNRFAAVVMGLALGVVPPALAADMPKAAPSSPAAPAVAAAPFGLEWGLSKEELEAKGIKLAEVPTNEGSQRFSATGLSKLVAGVETVVVDFGFDNRLWKVIAASEDFPNDPYGFKVKARYGELNDILTEKYGKGKATHRTGGSIYDEARYFLAPQRRQELALHDLQRVRLEHRTQRAREGQRHRVLGADLQQHRAGQGLRQGQG